MTKIGVGCASIGVSECVHMQVRMCMRVYMRVRVRV